MKRIASATIVGAILVLAPVGIAGAASADTYYANCDAVFAAWQSNILRGEEGYRPGLDSDSDGVACEREGSGSGSNSGSSNENESTSSGSSQSSSGEDSSTGDQVEVVPAGGAETGDGSTTGYTAWWLGGGLVAGLAGLLTTRRLRPGAVSPRA